MFSRSGKLILILLIVGCLAIFGVWRGTGPGSPHWRGLLSALVGMVFLLAVLVPFTGGVAALRTRRLGMHVVRALCVVFVGGGEAEKGNQPIAFVAIDFAAIAVDLGAQELQDVAHDLDPVLGVDLSDQGGGAFDVGKHDCDHTALALQPPFAPSRWG